MTLGYSIGKVFMVLAVAEHVLIARGFEADDLNEKLKASGHA
jgi:hypothetical protein